LLHLKYVSAFIHVSQRILLNCMTYFINDDSSVRRTVREVVGLICQGNRPPTASDISPLRLCHLAHSYPRYAGHSRRLVDDAHLLHHHEGMQSHAISLVKTASPDRAGNLCVPIYALLFVCISRGSSITICLFVKLDYRMLVNTRGLRVKSS